MQRSATKIRWPFACLIAAFVWLGATPGVRAQVDPASSVAPLPPGPYPVACSDVAQNFALAPTDADREDYWDGTAVGGQGHYITQLLSEPQSSFLYNIQVPNVEGLFNVFHGSSVPYVALVCYPTSADNSRPDYAFDAEMTQFVPKMARAGQAPLWADPNAQYPVLLYSHGLEGSPLDGGYLPTITLYASYGYVVVAPFHGDGRFDDLSISDLSDLVQFFLNDGFPKVIELQAIRPLSLQGVLDALFADPDYSAHVDPTRVAGFGASLGGESLMLLAGAQLTTSFIPNIQMSPVVTDPRLKAIVGYVPYFGQPILPAFGDNQNGLAGLSVPFLGMSGTADTTAPIQTTASGVERLQGARYLVAFQGLTHTLVAADVPAIFTWSIIFLDAYLQNDPVARAQMAHMDQVPGAADQDLLQIDYTSPLPPQPSEQLIVEYFNPALVRYFLSADPAEEAVIDSGGAGPGWQRTGYLAKAWDSAAATGSPVCRLYGAPPLAPNAHFYTISAAECQAVSGIPGWIFEGYPFRASPTSAGICPATLVPVLRNYSGPLASGSDHRYTTSRWLYSQMQAIGWEGEGTVFCTNP